MGPDYVLGPGDSLQINVWGSTQLAFTQSVDRNGEINLPNVGPVRVWGLTFDDAGKVIRRQLTRYFRGIKTNITMGRLRTIRVYVVGEVCQPGSYTLSSLSTLTNALFAAGGPVKLGTLRNISLKRNHHTVGTTDLYDFLLRGDKTRDFRLQSGDTIFVPPVGSIAAITGEVKRPAIYELKGTTRVSDLIELAGGTTPRSYLKRIQVIRTNPNVGREIIDLDLTASQMNGGSPDIALQNGDLVSIYPTDPRIYNTVRLLGAVKHPGEYEFKTDMRLSQLIQRSGVLPEAHIDRIEIARLNADLKTEILEVSLKGAWAGDESQDITLKPLDQITVRSEYRKAWTVKLEGEFKRPGTFTIKPGERLSAVLRRAGGFTEKAYPKGVIFTRRSVAEAEAKVLKDFVKDQEKNLLAETTQLTTTISTLSRGEGETKQAVLGQRIELLHLLAAKVTLGRIVVKMDDPDKLEGSPNDLVLQDGDTIKVPQIPSTVMVMGSVRNPTAVLHQEDKDVQYYLNRAGGLTPEAASKEMYLLKGDGSAIAGFMSLRSIEPGDVIIVPPSTEAKVAWFSLMRDIAGILGEVGKVAIGMAGLATIF
ncbi:MAG: SLBB domain-containing protein [Deltaproteobacteria bacterium]|nr:SLBB domain-containing protein [Deltaproteobacteria bacterium]